MGILRRYWALTLAILLTAQVLAFSLYAPAFTLPQAAAKGVKIAFTTGHGEAGRKATLPELANLEGNLTAAGDSTVEINGTITSSALANVQFLILGSVFGKNYTSDEVAAVKSWFETGRKAIWVSSDSDYGGGNYIIVNTNRMLEAIGSKIRVEPTQVLDPVSNAKADYRVVAKVLNTADSEVASIVKGVAGTLYHGPTILAGIQDGKWVPLETTKIENVYWVVKTSADSVITDMDLPKGAEFGPKAHENGAKGSFVIFAVEKFAGPQKNSKIIVTGGAPYGDYEPIYKTSYYDLPLTGPTLVLNAVQWGEVIDEPSFFTPTNIALIAAVVVVVVVAVGIVALRRRGKPA